MLNELQIVIELLLIASLVAVAIKYIRIPYTVALVIVGFTLSFARQFLPGAEAFHLTQELVFLVFLPPLLFEGAINMDLELLRINAVYVFMLAFGATLLTCLLVGFSLHLTLGFGLVYALLLGTILAPTDPVSVLAIFREQGVNKELSTIVEGESVFNDGIGVVLFLVLLERITSPNEFSYGAGNIKLLWEVGMGSLIGIIIGYMVHRLLGKIDDHLTEVTISLVLAYGVYILADRAHASGVIAVVCAGLIMGNYGKVLSMSPTTRLTLTSFWEVAAFLANSLLFLLIGLEARPDNLIQNWKMIVLIFVLLVVFRSAAVYGLFAGLRSFRSVPPYSWLHVINWGGLRGSIPIALALGLPLSFNFSTGHTTMTRTDIISIVFGVVLLSLLLQGLSIKKIVNNLGLAGLSGAPRTYQHLRGRIIATQAAHETIQLLRRKGEISEQIYDKINQELEMMAQEYGLEMKGFLAEHNDLHAAEYATITRSLLLDQRSALQEAAQRGILSEHVTTDLIREIDTRLSINQDNVSKP
ncbi:Na+/H+ antiporter [bacterium]|nr:Na+/H+ antiporter [bacterium]